MDFSKKNEKFLVGLSVAALILVLGGIYLASKNSHERVRVDKDSYQTVFLDNNQQYFGHLNGAGTRNPYLTDVYYIQVQQQPAAEEGTTPQPRFTLIKRGGELHGPEDKMYLNPSKIIFWETLRADSQVIQSMMKEKAQRAATAQPVTSVTPTPAPTAPVAPTTSAPAPVVTPNPAR